MYFYCMISSKYVILIFAAIYNLFINKKYFLSCNINITIHNYGYLKRDPPCQLSWTKV